MGYRHVVDLDGLDMAFRAIGQKLSAAGHFAKRSKGMD
jgi:hypothetical protein